MTVSVNVRALPYLVRSEHTALFDGDADAVNTAATPDRVAPRRLDDLRIVDGRLDVVLPPVSWSMLRLLPA
jgi:alpha-N-arabinofuranosidase